MRKLKKLERSLRFRKSLAAVKYIHSSNLSEVANVSPFLAKLGRFSLAKHAPITESYFYPYIGHGRENGYP